MDAMLRKALRKYNGLRQQVDNVLLGEESDEWERELGNFLAKRPCWVTPNTARPSKRKKEGIVEIFIRVNRTRTPKEALAATGRQQYTDQKVVANMPRGEGEEVEVVFFHLGRYVSDADLDQEYELRGLKPADPYSLAAVNEADPSFADQKPSSTHWKDADGKWCFATFDRWSGGREVGVHRDNCDWGGGWWFAGLRKSARPDDSGRSGGVSA